MGVCGPRGSGKTLYAVGRYILPAMRAGLAVAAQIDVHDPRTAEHVRRLHDWADCLSVEDGWLLIDEAHRWAPSREWFSLPENARALWAQSRKYGLGMVLTFQHPGRIDRAMRELIDELYWIEPVKLAGRRTPYYRVWAVPLTQSLVTLGALPDGGTKRLWRAPNDAYDAYDSWQEVDPPTSRVTLIDAQNVTRDAVRAEWRRMLARDRQRRRRAKLAEQQTA